MADSTVPPNVDASDGDCGPTCHAQPDVNLGRCTEGIACDAGGGWTREGGVEAPTCTWVCVCDALKVSCALGCP